MLDEISNVLLSYRTSANISLRILAVYTSLKHNNRTKNSKIKGRTQKTYTITQITTMA